MGNKKTFDVEVSNFGTKRCDMARKKNAYTRTKIESTLIFEID